MKDFLFWDPLEKLDPAVYALIGYEAECQARKLIMIPSESISPPAIHEAMASVFSQIYAEGYPDERTRPMTQEEILDYEEQLGHYRRYDDARYYQGVAYADVLEALARRRTAEVFANGIPAEKIYVNVQPLSGAPANTAVQYALMEPNDTMLSMSLYVGGHLTHGSKVAYSGKTYNVVHYGVDPRTEQVDYAEVRRLALEHRPKLIITGYTSYPLRVEWKAFREIADEVGAYLLADISHVAGLIGAGVCPNPVGVAHVVTFTTHKSLNGPRGAVIITHDAKLAKKFDRAVFPGLQGGPHMDTIAGIAVAMEVAQMEQFKELQRQTVLNTKALAAALEKDGIRVPYGGTDCHMLLIDCKVVKGPDGTPLMGDPAARILERAGIVVNRNTIPGDTTAAYPSGVRMGTPWVTQRGFKEAEMAHIAHLIARLLKATEPYVVAKRKGVDYRARVDFDVLEEVKHEVSQLAAQASCYDPLVCPPDPVVRTGYPHFYSLDDAPAGHGAYERLELVGEQAKPFVDWLTPSYTAEMVAGETRPVTLLEADGKVMAAGLLKLTEEGSYLLDVPADKAVRVVTWLRALVDGYVATDDVYGRLPFLAAVRDLGKASAPELVVSPETGPFAKPYFIGAWSRKEPAGDPLPLFTWIEPENAPLRKTYLNETHREMGARMVPFGGWDMPVWYTSNLEEHNAVRHAAGLFDVSHMGCWDVSGPEAAAFLNLVMVNDVNTLDVGKSQYSALFDLDGIPLDDLMVYRMEEDRYLVVVNASNNDKDWAWVNGVLKGEVMIDPARPWVKWDAKGGVTLRDLRVASSGENQRAELAIQGPKARDILMALGGSAGDLAAVKSLSWAGITRVTLGGFDLIVTRTGYTGERIAYELFVHPDRLVAFWKRLLEVGDAMGIKACGLAARDSLRTEAGLPLYGHEMAGPLNLTMADAGFGTYVKTYKPFFVGREAFIARELKRKAGVIRFRVPEKGQPRPEQLDRLVDERGKVAGYVTSCAVDKEGFLLGQAYVDERYHKAGTQLSALVTPRRSPKPQAELEMGDRVQMPVLVEVLTRFPK